MGSKPGQFDSDDLRRTVRGLVTALAAATGTYLLAVVVPQLQTANTVVSLFTAAVLTAAIDAGRRWVNDNR